MTIKNTKPSAAEMLKRALHRQPDNEPEPQWYDIAIEFERRHREFEAEREAQRQAEEQASLPTPGFIASAIRQNARAIPLNGSQVLTAALAGGEGTINFHARNSGAGLVRQVLVGSVQDGRSR